MIININFLKDYLITQCSCIQFGKITFERLRTTSNPEYANFTMNTWKDANKESLINSSAYFNVEIEKMKVIDQTAIRTKLKQYYFSQVLVEIAMPKDPYDFEFGNVVFKTTVDVCKVFNGVVATFVVKAVLEHFEKTDDIGIQCPFKEV